MKAFDKSEALPVPWRWKEHDLTNQLEREISRTHVPFGEDLKTLARRRDNEYVSFLVDNEKFAVVHLHGQVKGILEIPTQ